ncbi:MAG: glyoxylate/hydroxypyruvate reductase A [Paracoccaceae bacterium]|jgi:glyoxylate/hydroxypyruvate reductase A
MPPVILFGGRPAQRDVWRAHLTAAADAQGLVMDLRMAPQDVAPEDVDAIIYNPDGPVQDFTPYTRLKGALNMWAGVEKIVDNATLRAPLTRMVEPGLTLGMTDWVVAHVMRRHAQIDRHLFMAKGAWPQDHPPLARDRRITVLGLGELGEASARALAGLGFQVTGWSRRQKAIAGVTCLCGDDGLTEALACAEFLILLLPLTPATENLLNAKTLRAMPKGAEIFNPGRGPLIDDDALLAALIDGQIGHATLDVFRTEPLPERHPFWDAPGVTVTPHIASVSRPDTAAGALVAQIVRMRDGLSFLHVVDRAQGY